MTFPRSLGRTTLGSDDGGGSWCNGDFSTPIARTTSSALAPRCSLVGFPKLSRPIEVVEKQAKMQGFELRKPERKRLLRLSGPINHNSMWRSRAQSIDLDAL